MKLLKKPLNSNKKNLKHIKYFNDENCSITFDFKKYIKHYDLLWIVV